VGKKGLGKIRLIPGPRKGDASLAQEVPTYITSPPDTERCSSAARLIYLSTREDSHGEVKRIVYKRSIVIICRGESSYDAEKLGKSTEAVGLREGDE